MQVLSLEHRRQPFSEPLFLASEITSSKLTFPQAYNFKVCVFTLKFGLGSSNTTAPRTAAVAAGVTTTATNNNNNKFLKLNQFHFGKPTWYKNLAWIVLFYLLLKQVGKKNNRACLFPTQIFWKRSTSELKILMLARSHCGAPSPPTHLPEPTRICQKLMDFTSHP